MPEIKIGAPGCVALDLRMQMLGHTPMVTVGASLRLAREGTLPR